MAEDFRKIENRLHMFSYYGQIAWQIFAIFVATATLLATLPFIIPSDRLPQGVLSTYYFVFNEVYAGFFLLIGIGFMERNLTLAHRWIHWPSETYNTSPQYWVDWVEQGKPNPTEPPPKTSILTGHHYLAIAAVLALTYIIGIGIFLIFH